MGEMSAGAELRSDQMFSRIAASHPGSQPAVVGIAVIGTGPRGIAVLERIGARLSLDKPSQEVFLHVVDDVEVGCGRIWNTKQPPWLVMNNRCGEVTMFSGPADEGAWRPGSGPTFAEWWRQVDAKYPGPSVYAPRAVYGRYLKFVLDTVEVNLPCNVTLVRHQSKVLGLEKSGGRFVLWLNSNEPLKVDRVVVCVGHPLDVVDDRQATLAKVAEGSVRPSYIRAGSTAEMQLNGISKNDTIGVIGLGLTFYDVLSALTVGRGGRFVEGKAGLTYARSGAEPGRIVAGSRSGMPIPVRGSCQRAFDFRYAPRFFTSERVLALRANGPLDFRTDILPWILAEVNFVYVQKCMGQKLASSFAVSIPSETGTARTVLRLLEEQAAKLGIHKLVDIESIAAPFKGRTFQSQGEFRREFIETVEGDIAHSSLGDLDGPLKAALEVLRDTRPTIRLAVDLGGLSPASHKDFIENIAPVLAFLSTGPSRTRAKQLLALMQADLLEVLGPNAQFVPGATGKFDGYSPWVNDYRTPLDVVIDARVPAPDIERDPNPLVAGLIRSGIWRPFVNQGTTPLRTGGLDVTAAPFHPISKSGVPETRMCVLGITTEFTRWFMQVGIGRPGPWGEFFRDADAVAAAALLDTRASSRDKNGELRHLRDDELERLSPAPGKSTSRPYASF